MTAPARPELRALRFWVALFGVVLLAVLLVGPPRGEGPPLDPDSTDPLGTRALVLLLENRAATVDLVAVPDGRHDITLVLVDDLTDERRATVLDWTERGGTLVVTDPRSALHGLAPTGGPSFSVGDPTITDACTIPALAIVERVDPTGGLFYRPAEGATGCFSRGDAHFVMAQSRRAGTVVAVGGAGTFVNGAIGAADNAVLAAALLAPRPATRVAFLRPPAPGDGDAGLFALVSPGVKQMVLQLGIAFGLYALWRARRLGRPVEEPLPVELAGSELVAAVGNLLQQARRRDQAAAVLRRRLVRDLAERLGLAPGAPPEAVAAAAAARSGIPAVRLQAVLTDALVPDDAALVELAQTIDTIRQEVIHA